MRDLEAINDRLATGAFVLVAIDCGVALYTFPGWLKILPISILILAGIFAMLSSIGDA